MDEYSEVIWHVIIGFKKIGQNPKAIQSIKEEYDKLRSWPVWNEDGVREYWDVAAEAADNNPKIHFGRISITCA